LQAFGSLGYVIELLFAQPPSLFQTIFDFSFLQISSPPNKLLLFEAKRWQTIFVLG